MKKSELRQIIREEISKVVKENELPKTMVKRFKEFSEMSKWLENSPEVKAYKDVDGIYDKENKEYVITLNKLKTGSNKGKFEDEFEDDDFDLEQAFDKAPNKASYNDVLFIIQSYENEDILTDFKSKFPVGKPISKQSYYNFAMNYVDDSNYEAYVQANWISLFDDDIFDKAGL